MPKTISLAYTTAIRTHHPNDEALYRPKSRTNKTATTIKAYLQATINLFNYDYAFG